MKRMVDDGPVGRTTGYLCSYCGGRSAGEHTCLRKLKHRIDEQQRQIDTLISLFGTHQHGSHEILTNHVHGMDTDITTGPPRDVR